ncbi:MAG: pantetheine-phosphate adenylyltransferase [Acidiferrobacteraceae bacterium]
MNVVAIYPGTFDPFTNGHSELVEHALGLFDEVVVAVAENPEKHTMFSLDERIALARAVLKDTRRARVIGFHGLLVHCARDCGAKVILRGLRAVSDFEYEFQMAGMNRRLDPRFETVFLTPSEKDTYISASLVREIAKLGGDVGAFVHPAVKAAIEAKLR